MFPTLFPRRKWRVERRNVRIDDIMTVTDENAVRGSWTMDRIVDVFPGADGKVRKVKVKTTKRVYSRPVVFKIYICEDNNFLCVYFQLYFKTHQNSLGKLEPEGIFYLV